MTDEAANMLQYHIMRADQERRYAAATKDPTARTAHEELAALHRRRIEELRIEDSARPTLRPSYLAQG